MKKLFGVILIIAALSGFGPASVDAGEPDMVIVIHFADRDAAYDALRPFRLTYEDVRDTWARALVKPSILPKIEALGFDVEVLWEDARERARDRREAMGDRWTSYTATVGEMQGLATSYPDIVRLHNIGQTVQNRDIWVMEITDNPDTDEPDEPEVRLVGNIHGDEYMSLELMRLLMQYLTSNYGSDPEVTDLVNSREIWIQPSVNPDGHEIGSRYNANGVDMNRNHGYMWAGGGSGPFSEPELQVFREWSLNRNFTTSLSFHGETTYFNYTWNFSAEDVPDKQLLEDWGAVYVLDNGYTVTEGWDWYQTNGDTNDWSYGCRGSLDVTIETPHYSENWIQQEFDENINGMLYTIEIAGYGLTGIVTDVNTGQPLEAMVLVHQVPMPVFTDPLAGDYHRALQAGTYDITVWANGYAPATVTNIAVASEDVTVRNVQLSPNYAHYAMQVAWTTIDDYYESNSANWPNYMWPHNALGPADDVPGSLGENCVFTFDMGAGFEIEDLPGNDMIVYEAASAGDGDEGCQVYGSSGGFL
ncbi:MAG TPA: M14 family zinc carboxypeptidase, partial [bacterium]|nr:M14 family zinc carboxypeptidase [bacterium]